MKKQNSLGGGEWNVKGYFVFQILQENLVSNANKLLKIFQWWIRRWMKNFFYGNGSKQKITFFILFRSKALSTEKVFFPTNNFNFVKTTPWKVVLWKKKKKLKGKSMLMFPSIYVGGCKNLKNGKLKEFWSRSSKNGKKTKG